jgi:cellulose synthase/poly-beta-1,6-N-acetylglucosamine synthase-like glycosyltransferase
LRRAGRSVLGVAAVAAQLPIAAMSAYLGTITAAAWLAVIRGRHRTSVRADPTTRFVVMIPAHDEERLIGATLDSLHHVAYPTDRYSVHVVADHCTDKTVDIARQHGADVHQHDLPDSRGKGPALQWMYGRLVEQGAPHDAVVIIDADTVVSANLLSVMDARLAAGAEAVQAYYAVRQPEGSAAAALRAAALAGRHYLRPLGRTTLGASSGLYGNGMVFSSAVLSGRTWTKHLTEDIEFQMSLLLDGTLVDFAGDAVVEAEMPATLEAARTQNERWERGRVDLARRFVPLLLRRAARTRGRSRVALLDAATDHVVPPFSLLVAASITAGGLSLLAPPGRAVGVAARSLAAASLATQGAYVLSGLRMVNAPAPVWRSLLGAPRLVVWKIAVWLRVLREPDETAWIRTARNEESA